MGLYLNRLKKTEYDSLQLKLHTIQNGVCFICEEPMDLEIHEGSLDVDHIIPTKMGGKDHPDNFALTHNSCNRSKQDANLEVAKVLHRFKKIRDALSTENRGPNLDDILKANEGAKFNIKFIRENNAVRYSFSEIADNHIHEVPIHQDTLSGFEYFFAVIPIEYLFHDDKINPRSIGLNISKLVKEFHRKRPQLHVSLGWISFENGNDKIRVFDGQHKAAAQIMLGTRKLPIRIFVNPDADVLLTTNTNAGTTLRQVAFDKSVQRHLGSTLYRERIQRFKEETHRHEDDYSFSERDLLSFFRGESREIKRYIIDNVRDGITHSSDNRLKDYIDFGGRKTERPLSYSSIEKTFYSFFIYKNVLDTPLDFKMGDGENPREIEKEQIVKLMNVIAEEVFIGKFDTDIGTRRIESRIQKDETFPMAHVRAFRMSKEEILYNWLKYIEQIIKSYFYGQGQFVSEEKLFQYKFPDQVWKNIRHFIIALVNLPVWINNELSSTVFGGKQNYDFWRTIFETGSSPHGQEVLVQPLNWMEMVKEKMVAG